MKNTHPSRSRQRLGFTLIELLVVISIISLLIGILLPALSSARKSANNLMCLTKTKQIHLSFMTYAADHKDHVPPAETIDASGANVASGTWFNQLIPYLNYSSDIWTCPSAPDAQPSGTSTFPDGTQVTATMGYQANLLSRDWYISGTQTARRRKVGLLRRVDLRNTAWNAKAEQVRVDEVQSDTIVLFDYARATTQAQILGSNNAQDMRNGPFLGNHDNTSSSFVFIDGHASQESQQGITDNPGYSVATWETTSDTFPGPYINAATSDSGPGWNSQVDFGGDDNYWTREK